MVGCLGIFIIICYSLFVIHYTYGVVFVRQSDIGNTLLSHLQDVQEARDIKGFIDVCKFASYLIGKLKKIGVFRLEFGPDTTDASIAVDDGEVCCDVWQNPCEKIYIERIEDEEGVFVVIYVLGNFSCCREIQSQVI